MELQLDRRLAERRIFPAVDVLKSSTRREELLLDEQTLRLVWMLRRMLTQVGQSESAELLLTRLTKTASNREFLATLAKADV
jgi:transcription termination factor Rho